MAWPSHGLCNLQSELLPQLGAGVVPQLAWVETAFGDPDFQLSPLLLAQTLAVLGIGLFAFALPALLALDKLPLQMLRWREGP